MFEELFENEEEKNFIFDILSDFAKCNGVIDVIKQEKLETNRNDENKYRFANMAYIVQKVFDSDPDAIHAFADFLNENIEKVLFEMNCYKTERR